MHLTCFHVLICLCVYASYFGGAFDFGRWVNCAFRRMSVVSCAWTSVIIRWYCILSLMSLIVYRSDQAVYDSAWWEESVMSSSCTHVLCIAARSWRSSWSDGVKQWTRVANLSTVVMSSLWFVFVWNQCGTSLSSHCDVSSYVPFQSHDFNEWIVFWYPHLLMVWCDCIRSRRSVRV